MKVIRHSNIRGSRCVCNNLTGTGKQNFESQKKKNKLLDGSVQQGNLNDQLLFHANLLSYPSGFHPTHTHTHTYILIFPVTGELQPLLVNAHF